MYSLTDLNLSENNFTDIGSVLTLGELPCLEIIDFRENSMTKEPIYRLRILTAFDDRAEQVSNKSCLIVIYEPRLRGYPQGNEWWLHKRDSLLKQG